MGETQKKLSEKDPVKCNFCYKNYEDVNKLIACGFVYICDSCVRTCVDILKDMEEKEKKFEKLFRPKNAKEAINQAVEAIGKGDK